MVVGIAEDFTSDVVFDSQLKGTPLSGLFLNSGVHPSITVENLLSFLPSDFTVTATWKAATTYGIFETTRNKRDLVVKDDKIYQSIKASNLNQDPTTETDYWIETNIESLRLKDLIFKVIDKVKSDLHLTKRLVNNQFIYEVGENVVTLPNDYAAWVFEPKGSDYVSIRLNQISFQKTGSTPVNLYVINQGVLVDTLIITPSNGVVEFKELDYMFKGKGKWTFAIDSTDVIIGNGYVDPLYYDGFICYTASGIGEAPETATYNINTRGNGLGFNITAFLDSEVYFDNNVNEFGNFIRATFEYMVFTMFLHNSNNQSDHAQRWQMDSKTLLMELKDEKVDSVIRRYKNEKKQALKKLEKTFDSQLSDEGGFEVTMSTI